MNLETARQLRHALANGEWLTRTRAFATALRTAGHQPGELLLVGTPDDEPWHFAAHLDDAARLTGQRQLTPTLVRHHVPLGARPHLAVDLSRLNTAARGETLLVVSPHAAQPDLLNRIDDARHRGAAIFAMNAGDDNVNSLAHEALVVTQPALTLDATEHLVCLAATEQPTGRLERGLARLIRR